MALCSVIVPAYNCEKTVKASVVSILKQTWGEIEVLIVNDASTDGTRAVLADLAKADERVVVTNLRKNRGVAEARNLLIGRATGEYIAFLDADDLWKADKLEKQIALLKESEADLVYSSYRFIDGKGKDLGSQKIVPSVCSFTDLLKENFILPSTVVMKSSWAQKYTMDGSYSHEDYVYWLAMLKDGLKAVGNPEILVDYRIFEANRSGDKRRAAKNRWIVYRKFLGYNPLKSLYYFAHYALNGLKKYRGL